MSQTPDNRIMALVHACAGMSESERNEYLENECSNGSTIRGEIDAILADAAGQTALHEGPSQLAKVLPEYYRLKGILGSGGMGTVYLAEDSRLDRRVAIKFLKDTFSKDRERLSRFHQEARSASALNHPNIIAIYDIGEGDGVRYIVSEYIEGETLGSRIARGRLTPDESLDISIQIASALKAAHETGVIHRDLKPDNIMLRPDGTAKVVDFGLAKGAGGVFASGPDGTAINLIATSPGTILGTPRYMSPEQTRGLPLDARSDIFSLGLIIFEMLTGHSPFGGASTADTIAAIISNPPRRLDAYISEPPDGFEPIIARALEKKREDRYPMMERMLEDLVALREDRAGHSWSARKTSEVSAVSASAGRVPKSWPWAAAAAVIALIGFAGWWFFVGRSPDSSVNASMRTVPITSWSSVSGESVAAAAFSRDAKMVAFASTRSGATEIWIKPTVGGEPIQATRNGFYNQYPVWSPDNAEIAFFSSRGETNGLWRVSFTGGQEVQIVGGLSATAKPVRWLSDHSICYQEGTDLFSIDPASGTRKQLTDLASTTVRPAAFAISPDGSSIAISVKENSVWKLKTKRLDADAFTEVATSKDRIDSIQFYADGRSLLYTGGTDGIQQIYSVTPGSGTPVQISSGSTDAAFQDVSSDGSKILFGSLSESSDLWMADTSGGKETVVANDVPAEYWADISPDGKSVVYQSVSLPERPFRGSVYAKPLGSGQQVMISPEGFLPLWSPDGQWIAFLRRVDGVLSIWKARPSGADATKLAEGEIATPGYSNVPYLQTGVGTIAWTPDSTAVAYSAKVGGVSNMWLAPVAGGEPRQFSSNKDPNQTLASIVWSQDGKSVAYNSAKAPGPDQPRARRLWLSADGAREAKLLVETRSDFRFLGFAQSGEAVIAEKADPTDVSPTPAKIYVYLINTNTGARRKAVELGNAYFYNIHLSIDGQALAFVTRANEVSTIWTVPTAGGATKKIVVQNDPKVLISSLAWAPDGKSIVFGKQTRTNVLSMLTN